MNPEPPTDFISEPVKPDPGTFETSSMARGEPGLPAGFTWRNTHYHITELLDSWKESVSENHADGERYYRKRFFTIRAETGEKMTLYALRHVAKGSSPRANKQRWWLYTLQRQ